MGGVGHGFLILIGASRGFRRQVADPSHIGGHGVQRVVTVDAGIVGPDPDDVHGILQVDCRVGQCPRCDVRGGRRDGSGEERPGAVLGASWN